MRLASDSGPGIRRFPTFGKCLSRSKSERWVVSRSSDRSPLIHHAMRILALLLTIRFVTSLHAGPLPGPVPGSFFQSDRFPIAVWLQSPSNAARYQAAGVNLYVGLWKGPT